MHTIANIRFISCLELIRWDKPAGTLLLIWPPLWCLFLLADTWPPLDIVAAFIFGAFFMRSAGCVINDITDRKLDAQVERTKNRPLASGALSVRAALALLFVLLLGAAAAALYLGAAVILAALVALPLVIAYPWMKRITFWPQLFLGITFNYGVLLASIALTGGIQPMAWWLYAACVFWTLGYDTIYGFQDIKDDERVGIKSTARRWQRYAKLSVSLAYGLFMMLLMVSLSYANLAPHAGAWLFAVALQLFWQIYRLDIDQPDMCMRLFKSNAWAAGPLVCVAIIMASGM